MKYERIGSPSMTKVTKYNPCPICGKPDWCFSSTSTYSFDDGPDEDFIFIGCRRTSAQSIAGTDGEYYTMSHESDQGVVFYEEVHQRAKRFNRMGIDNNIKVSKNYKAKSSKRRVCNEKYTLASIDRRDAVYRALLELLHLEDYHRKNFYEEGWDDNLLESSNFKSLPPTGYNLSNIIKKKKRKEPLTPYEEVSLNRRNKTRKQIANQLYLKFGDLEGIPGFYLKESNYQNKKELSWTFTGAQGVIMPQYDVNGKIFALRIRLDESKGGKYKWFTSVYEKLEDETDTEKIFKNVYSRGSKPPCEISYRFPAYQTKFLFATEGEKKQHVVVEEEGLACASVPGVGNFSSILNDVSTLKELGIEVIIIGYDADKKENTQVLMSELKLIETLLLEGFQIYIAEWDASHGKGVDDVILRGIQPLYTPLLDYLKQFEAVS